MLQTPWLKTHKALGVETPEPAGRTLADYVEEHSRLRPDAPAVHYFVRSWTYAQVNAEANRLANALRALGIGPGDVVGCPI